jgi:hypothetical protein
MIEIRLVRLYPRELAVIGAGKEGLPIMLGNP